jgi:antagonist of KipI
MEVLKAGILDTFQDLGRKGFAHIGIGPGGCIDTIAGRLANVLTGNEETTPILEMHFPAPVLKFPEGAIIALTGADFGAFSSGKFLPVNRRIFLPAGATLAFKQKLWGQRCYLAVAGGWVIPPVLGSTSTHVKAGFGGWHGRALRSKDEVKVKVEIKDEVKVDVEVAKWYIKADEIYAKGSIRVIPGPEWDWLTETSKKSILNESFTISRNSDRMGYYLNGPVLNREVQTELLSSGVLPGTIQLLPNGNPLLLMADCQTTGGYPRILQVALADLPSLAQKGPGELLNFEMITLEDAIEKNNQVEKELGAIKQSIQWQQ